MRQQRVSSGVSTHYSVAKDAGLKLHPSLSSPGEAVPFNAPTGHHPLPYPVTPVIPQPQHSTTTQRRSTLSAADTAPWDSRPLSKHTLSVPQQARKPSPMQPGPTVCDAAAHPMVQTTRAPARIVARSSAAAQRPASAYKSTPSNSTKQLAVKETTQRGPATAQRLPPPHMARTQGHPADKQGASLTSPGSSPVHGHGSQDANPPSLHMSSVPDRHHAETVPIYAPKQGGIQRATSGKRVQSFRSRIRRRFAATQSASDTLGPTDLTPDLNNSFITVPSASPQLAAGAAATDSPSSSFTSQLPSASPQVAPPAPTAYQQTPKFSSGTSRNTAKEAALTAGWNAAPELAVMADKRHATLATTPSPGSSLQLQLEHVSNNGMSNYQQDSSLQNDKFTEARQPTQMPANKHSGSDVRLNFLPVNSTSTAAPQSSKDAVQQPQQPAAASNQSRRAVRRRSRLNQAQALSQPPHQHPGSTVPDLSQASFEGAAEHFGTPPASAPALLPEPEPSGYSARATLRPPFDTAAALANPGSNQESTGRYTQSSTSANAKRSPAHLPGLKQPLYDTASMTAGFAPISKQAANPQPAPLDPSINHKGTGSKHLPLPPPTSATYRTLLTTAAPAASPAAATAGAASSPFLLQPHPTMQPLHPGIDISQHMRQDLIEHLPQLLESVNLGRHHPDLSNTIVPCWVCLKQREDDFLDIHLHWAPLNDDTLRSTPVPIPVWHSVPRGARMFSQADVSAPGWHSFEVVVEGDIGPEERDVLFPNLVRHHNRTMHNARGPSDLVDFLADATQDGVLTHLRNIALLHNGSLSGESCYFLLTQRWGLEQLQAVGVVPLVVCNFITAVRSKQPALVEV